MAEDVLNRMDAEDLRTYARMQEEWEDDLEKLIVAKEQIISALENLIVSREYEAAKRKAYNERMKKVTGRRKLMERKYGEGEI